VRRKDARTAVAQDREGTHVCGDPGTQFVATIHKGHPLQDRIGNSTNPESEYSLLDNTACNLDVTQREKFKAADGDLIASDSRRPCAFLLRAGNMWTPHVYPIKRIAGKFAFIFGTLGLDYANLARLL